MKTQITKTVLLFVAMVMMQMSFALPPINVTLPNNYKPTYPAAFFKRMLYDKNKPDATSVSTEALISIMSTKKTEAQQGYYYNAYIGPLDEISYKNNGSQNFTKFYDNRPDNISTIPQAPLLRLGGYMFLGDRFENGLQPFNVNSKEIVEVLINTANYMVTVKVKGWPSKYYKCQPKNNNILYGFSSDGDMITISFGKTERIDGGR